MKFLAILILGVLTSPHSHAAGPVLSATIQGRTITWDRDQLLQSKFLEKNVKVERDPSYEYVSRTYPAIALGQLLAGYEIEADAVFEFKSLDGFTSVLSKERLLDPAPQAARAYIAIEPAENWPPLKKTKGSAGPFYLIWSHPEASNIGREEWPFQVVSFAVKSSLAKQYPKILPQPAAKAGSALSRGFTSFVKNCFSCHTLNGEGASQMGPDLNVPMSPTEYLRESGLRAYVRDPQAVRHWPQSRMTPFPKNILAEAELNDIIIYLKHMAKQRARK
jgi:cytochrome c2